MIMQNEWERCRQDIDTFQTMSRQAGFVPKAPIILDQRLLCRDARGGQRARDPMILAASGSRSTTTIISPTGTANVKGYEAYGKTAKTYARLKDPANLKKARPTSMSRSRSSARPTTACSNQRAAEGDRARSPWRSSPSATCRITRRRRTRACSPTAPPTLQRDPARRARTQRDGPRAPASRVRRHLRASLSGEASRPSACRGSPVGPDGIGAAHRRRGDPPNDHPRLARGVRLARLPVPLQLRLERSQHMRRQEPLQSAHRAARHLLQPMTSRWRGHRGIPPHPRLSARLFLPRLRELCRIHRVVISAWSNEGASACR